MTSRCSCSRWRSCLKSCLHPSGRSFWRETERSCVRVFVRGKVEARTDVMEACSRAEGVSSEKMQAYAVSADSETESSWFDWKGSRVFGRSWKVGRKKSPDAFRRLSLKSVSFECRFRGRRNCGLGWNSVLSGHGCAGAGARYSCGNMSDNEYGGRGSGHCHSRKKSSRDHRGRGRRIPEGRRKPGRARAAVSVS